MGSPRSFPCREITKNSVNIEGIFLFYLQTSATKKGVQFHIQLNCIVLLTIDSAPKQLYRNPDEGP